MRLDGTWFTCKEKCSLYGVINRSLVIVGCRQHVLCSAQEQACRADIVRMLVSNAVQLDIQESRGWTALKFAVRNGKVTAVFSLNC